MLLMTLQAELKESTKNHLELRAATHDYDEVAAKCTNLEATVQTVNAQLQHERQQVTELQAALDGARHDGQAMRKATYDERIRQLEDDLKKSEQLYHIVKRQDELTNGDDIRRRAALEPELSAENKRLNAELEEQEAVNARLQKTIDELTAEEWIVCRWVDTDNRKHCFARFHAEEVRSVHVVLLGFVELISML